MKAKNKLFIVLIVLCIVVMMSCSIAIVFAANPGVDVGPEDKSFNYKGEVGFELSGDGTYYSVTRCEDLNGDHKVIIPDTYDGKPVQEIKSGAVNDINVWSLTLGANVTDIRTGAFNSNPNYELISLNIPVSGNYPVQSILIGKGALPNTWYYDCFNICPAGYEEDFSTYKSKSEIVAAFDPFDGDQTLISKYTTQAKSFFSMVKDYWRVNIKDFEDGNTSWLPDYPSSPIMKQYEVDTTGVYANVIDTVREVLYSEFYNHLYTNDPDMEEYCAKEVGFQDVDYGL